MNVPISEELILPVAKSNLQFVNSLEDFEKIELDKNETRGCFDNYRNCLYVRTRDKYGEYSAVKVYFYEDFATHMQNNKDKEFFDKCKELKLDKLRTEIAYKFFIENEKTQSVWLWLLETKKADWEYDTVKQLRYKLKKAFLSLN